jgi:hypothetical protein
MAVQVGVEAGFGFKDEVTWGTEVVVDRFNEIRSESIQLQRQLIESEGLRSGRRNLQRSGVYSFYHKGATGDVEMEWMNKGMGWWLKHMLGGTATAANTPVASAHTHTGSIATTTGDSFTAQVARDTFPFTYSGCKLSGWELACGLDEILVLTASIMAKREVAGRFVTDGATTNASPTVTSATAVFTAYDIGKKISGTGIPALTTIIAVGGATSITLSANATATATGLTLTIGSPEATASYPSGMVPLSFVHGALTVGGVATDITSFSLSCDMNLPERWFFGGINKEPLDQGRTITGEFESEFEDTSIYQRFVTGTEAALVLTFSTAAQGLYVTGTTPYSLTITCPAVRYDGETPNVDGPEIIGQTTPFTVLNDDMTLVIVNGDATA